MRLLISGLAGVAVACLIFAIVVNVPWHIPPRILLGVSVGGDELLRLEGPRGAAYESSTSSPICVLNVTLFEFSKPTGPGSEADLSITLISRLNYSETFYMNAKARSLAEGSEYYTKHFPGGISLVDGGLEWSWTGNIESNNTKKLGYRIKATGIGIACLRIEMTTKFKETVPGSSIYEGVREWVDLRFTVLPDNVLVYSSYPHPKPHVFLSMTILDWSHMSGVGSEANVSISLLSENATNVTSRFITQEGISVIEGQTTWTGNITSYNITSHGETLVYAGNMTLNARLRFVKIGAWFIYAFVEKNGILCSSPDAMEFIVSENSSMLWDM